MFCCITASQAESPTVAFSKAEAKFAKGRPEKIDAPRGAAEAALEALTLGLDGIHARCAMSAAAAAAFGEEACGALAWCAFTLGRARTEAAKALGGPGRGDACVWRPAGGTGEGV